MKSLFLLSSLISSIFCATAPSVSIGNVNSIVEGCPQPKVSISQDAPSLIINYDLSSLKQGYTVTSGTPQRCLMKIDINFNSTEQTFAITDSKLEGKVKLASGTAVSMDQTIAWWGVWDEGKFSPVRLNGPLDSTFEKSSSNTTSLMAPCVTSTGDGFSSAVNGGTLTLQNTFSLSGTGNEAAEFYGFRQTFNLTWFDRCFYYCYDRTGAKLPSCLS